MIVCAVPSASLVTKKSSLAPTSNGVADEATSLEGATSPGDLNRRARSYRSRTGGADTLLGVSTGLGVGGAGLGAAVGVGRAIGEGAAVGLGVAIEGAGAGAGSGDGLAAVGCAVGGTVRTGSGLPNAAGAGGCTVGCDVGVASGRLAFGPLVGDGSSDRAGSSPQDAASVAIAMTMATNPVHRRARSNILPKMLIRLKSITRSRDLPWPQGPVTAHRTCR